MAKKRKAVKPEVLPAKVGRPAIEINWEAFERLCQMQCTKEEIAAWFSCSLDTLENKCHDEYGQNFSAIYQEKKLGGRISMRRAQIQLALTGNPTMLIWLGKQHLDQRDQPEVKAVEQETDKLVINFSGKQLEGDQEDE